MKVHQPYIIAGPNGPGKTSFAQTFLPHYAHCILFINADLLARGLSPFKPEKAAIGASRLMLQKIHELSRHRADFSFETTLAGKLYIQLTKHLKRRDYKANIISS